MPNDIAERSDIGPRLIRRDFVHHAFELSRRLGDAQQATLYRVAGQPIVGEVRITMITRILYDPLDVFENVVEPLQGLIRRQRYDPFRSIFVIVLSEWVPQSDRPGARGWTQVVRVADRSAR